MAGEGVGPELSSESSPFVATAQPWGRTWWKSQGKMQVVWEKPSARCVGLLA